MKNETKQELINKIKEIKEHRKHNKNRVTKFLCNGETYFYYLRDNKNQIFGGVALKKSESVWCRGMTLWAEGIDQFSKKECRRQATNRLIHAAMSKKDDLPVVRSTGRAPHKKLFQFYPSFFANDYGFKSRYGAVLTEEECEIVEEEL